jgi:CubicO group peptidase (beta-lactamase class C family)
MTMATTTETSVLGERLEELRDRHGVPAASVAVLRGDEVDAAASGILNLGTGVEATDDSLFQIGSITKAWTATLAMQLVDEGRIELDAPVRRYLPGFRVADEEVSEAVTIRHLLTHTSGIDGDHFADTGRGDDYLERYVETCVELPQVHPLGATMSYCNTGFTILGRVLEAVTDTVWDDLLRERLIEPLGLTHTVTLPEDVLRFRAAIGHIQPPGQELRPAPMWGLPRTAGPAGAICSTATEVLGFAALHLRDGLAADGTRLLSEDSARAMRERQVEVPTGGIDESEAHWGLGWSVYTWSGRTVVGHDGGTIGQAAFLRVVPDANAAVALLTNGGDPYGLFRDLCGELLAETAGVQLPPPPVPAESPPAVDAASYVGRYDRAGASIEVVARDGDLIAVQTVTGLGSEMAPEPVELPLVPFDAEREVFLAQHPALKGAWLPVRFTTLGDGRRCLHIGGRATPRAD